jgi:hypothetical protein
MGKARFGVPFEEFAAEVDAEIAARELSPRYS